MPEEEHKICTSDIPVNFEAAVASELAVPAYQVESPRPVHGVRLLVPACFRNIALFLVAITGGYLAFEALIFRSGWYSRYLDPESAAGDLEQTFGDELRRATSGKKEVLVLGSSRLAEGFSAKVANEYKPHDGYWFINFAVPGTGARAWYYMVRDVDPHRNRYAAIAIPIEDYEEHDTVEDVADRVFELSQVINRLRFTDILPYSLSFSTWKSRLRVLRGATFKATEYQRDFQNFIEDPGERLRRVALFRAHGRDWAYEYPGIDRNLLGMRVDWVHRRITFPAGMPEDQRNFFTRVFFTDSPQRGKTRAYDLRWIGALADLYRGSKTRIIVYQTPRNAFPRPAVVTDHSWDITGEFKKRPGIIVIDRHVFESLEKTDLFADHLHLNSSGRKIFSPLLADTVKNSLARID